MTDKITLKTLLVFKKISYFLFSQLFFCFLEQFLLSWKHLFIVINFVIFFSFSIALIFFFFFFSFKIAFVPCLGSSGIVGNQTKQNRTAEKEVGSRRIMEKIVFFFFEVFLNCFLKSVSKFHRFSVFLWVRKQLCSFLRFCSHKELYHFLCDFLFLLFF